MSDQAALEQLLRERSVRFGDFLLASGQRSSYYIDCRLTTMSAQGMVLIGRLGLAAIREAGWAPDAIGGLTMGADPVAYAVAAASAEHRPSSTPSACARKPRPTAPAALIEGNFREGARVVVVEDVITSGGSAEKAIAAVREAGGIVLGVLAVVDRLQGGRAHLEGLGHAVVALTTTASFGVKV